MIRIDLLEQRVRTREAFCQSALDVLVVGGGIVGAGVARDAAMRGLRVGLIEQHDLAFGTSSRSSRLLHGGIRYLAQGRIGLVREASREKRVLHSIAPHLAEPLPFLFPTYRGTKWLLWQLRIGVKLYDLLCGGRNLGPSTSMSRAGTLEYLPGLNADRLTGAVRYFDGLTNDARLVIDTLRSAHAHGALVANFARLEEASPEGDLWLCRVRDTLLNEQSSVAARSVVNATGPWSQSLPQSSIQLRLSKGVHLVIDRRRLPVPDAVVMTEGDRILFAIPWGDRVILGTTDTDYSGPIDNPRTEPADVEYVLSVVNGFFPHASLTATDVRANWAGLRPLIADPHGRPSDISRAHEIRMPRPGWIDVAGGKLTTYRLIAEQVVDRALRHLKFAAATCRTADEALLPADAVRGVSGIVPPEPSQAVVEHFCQNEWAVHLDDVMTRRSGWRYYRDDADQVAERAAGWMQEIFGWDAVRRDDELAGYREG